MSAVELKQFEEQVKDFSYEEQLMAMKIIIEAMQKRQTDSEKIEMLKSEQEFASIRKAGYATIRELLKDDEW